VLRVIENGIDPVYFTTRPSPEVRVALTSTPDAFLIGASGNVRPAKGYDVLLRAMALLREDVPGVRLVIAGQAHGPLS
jgi:glycosyltransferase involved in cell wall biosynthesis